MRAFPFIINVLNKKKKQQRDYQYPIPLYNYHLLKSAMTEHEKLSLSKHVHETMHAHTRSTS